MGRSALQARSARTASASRVTICRLHSRRRNRNPSRCGHDPQGGARPAVGNQRSMAADNAAAWPRDAEIPLTDVRSVPKTGLARPPPTQQTARKGRLNFLYARDWRIEPTYSKHANRHHGRCDLHGLQGSVRMQERLDGRAASKVGAFGAIHGHFRVSRGLWRRNRLRNEQAFQARRQWNTCLYSLSLRWLFA